MNIILKLLGLNSFGYSSTSDDSVTNKILLSERSSVLLAASDANKESRERLTVIRKHIIAKAFSISDIYDRISIFEGECDEYKVYSKITTEEIEATIDWNSVFTESCINRYFPNSKLADDFPLRLKIIIEELHYDMYKCYIYLPEDEFYSLEMINNICFLEENCIDYYKDYKFEITETVIDYLYIHSLKAIIITDEVMIYTINERISRIKKHIEELRRHILARSRSLLVLNNIITGILESYIPGKYIRIPSDTCNFVESSIIQCHMHVRMASENQYIQKRTPQLIHIKFEEFINLEKIYEDLEKLQKRSNLNIYTTFESCCIFYLCILNFLCDNFSLIDELYSSLSFVSQNIKYLPTIDSNESNSAYLTHLISLIPNGFCHVLDKWHLENSYGNIQYNIYCLSFLRIVNYREHLGDQNKNETLDCISNLKPEEALNTFKDVINCYKAYFGVFCGQLNVSNSNFFMEVAYDICKIIASHLERINSSVFSRVIGKYMELCYALKRLTDKTMETSHIDNNYISISDYCDILNFYGIYHKTGLHINCIYNINFLLGQTSYITFLDFFFTLTPEDRTNRLYKATKSFVEHLSNVDYDISSCDEETHDIFCHIVKCLIEINQGDYDNISLPRESICKDLTTRSLKNQVSMEHYINSLEKKIWPNIYYFTDIFDSYEEEKYIKHSIKNLYEAKYVSEVYIKILYDVYCDFIGPSAEEKHGLLKSGVINRKNKKKMDKLLCDMIIDAFGLIQTAHESGDDIVEGMKTAQFLFKSLKQDYHDDIIRSVISKSNLSRHINIKDEIIKMVAVLGIYALFEEVKTQYLTLYILKIGLEYNNQSASTIYKNGCDVLLTYCDCLIINLRKSIERPNDTMLYNICDEIHDKMEFIDREENNLLIVAELMSFISNVSVITDNYTANDIELVMENMIMTLRALINRYLDDRVLDYTLSYCRIIFFMVRFVLFEIQENIKKTVTDFMYSAFAVLMELSVNIKPSGVTGKLGSFNFLTFGKIFLEIADNAEGSRKCKTLNSIIYHKIGELRTYDSCRNTYLLVRIICNVLHRKNHIETTHSKFISALYHLLKRFFLKSTENTNNESQRYELFCSICSILQEDIILLEIIGYKKVKDYFEEKMCYICYSEISGYPVKTKNCVCKSYPSDFICLIRYDLSKLMSKNKDELTPVCCICKK